MPISGGPPACVRTTTGEYLFVVVPSPRPPWELRPQHRAVVLRMRAHVIFTSALTAATFIRAGLPLVSAHAPLDRFALLVSAECRRRAHQRVFRSRAASRGIEHERAIRDLPR